MVHAMLYTQSVQADLPKEHCTTPSQPRQATAGRLSGHVYSGSCSQDFYKPHPLVETTLYGVLILLKLPATLLEAQTTLQATDFKSRLLEFDTGSLDDAALHRLKRTLNKPLLNVEVCLLCTTCFSAHSGHLLKVEVLLCLACCCHLVKGHPRQGMGSTGAERMPVPVTPWRPASCAAHQHTRLQRSSSPHHDDHHQFLATPPVHTV